MKNEFYFQLNITREQLNYAKELVDYSILHHPVSDIFHDDPGGKERQYEFRLTGTLGEVVFADAYGLNRPTRSFGAIDGQDFGQDFLLPGNGKTYSFDIKTMSRKNNKFRENYVLNLPAYQLNKENSITDYYFCISIHVNNDQYIASFIGFVSKDDVLNGNIGILYAEGTKRIKDNGGSFVFQRDTYEVDFKDISTPFITPEIEGIEGFSKNSILPAFTK